MLSPDGLAAAFAQLADAVIVTDLTGVVTFWNDAAEGLFGWSAAEMVGRPYADRFPADMRATIVAHIARRAAGEAFAGEYEDYRKDGSRVWIDGRVRRFADRHGTPVGILGVSHDITGRKHLEEQYRQAQKFEAVGRLAGGIAHDFNNLLTVILGFAELLKQESAADPPASLDEIIRAAERGAALTGQLLAYSRKQLLQPVPVDVNAVVRGTAAMVGRLIGEGIRLVVETASDLPPALADAHQLAQVVMNLAVNGRDAMPAGGTLTVATRATTVGPAEVGTDPEAQAGRYVGVGVTDTGEGMTAEVRARLFEPFFTTKAAGKGTGLGLALVYGIARQAGGFVRVESAPGRGTRVEVFLPAADGAALAPASPVPVAPSAGDRPDGGHVLVVEDDDTIRALVGRVLEQHGFRVTAAADAEAVAALPAAVVAGVDLVLVDVVLPGGGGVEVVRRVVAGRPGVRVLYTSGYTEDVDVLREIREQNRPFLHKPFTPAALVLAVREALR